MGGRRAADFVAFDCKSQEKAAHGHVVYAVQVVSKTASKGLQNGSHCPGNERCGVNLLLSWGGNVAKSGRGFSRFGIRLSYSK